MSEKPNIFEITRAKFLFGILPPIVVGTTTAVYITGEFKPIGLVLVLLIGFSLQISMQVFNDIYDTMHGSDTDMSIESDYSGGSGVLLEYPELRIKMLMIGTIGLITAGIGTLLLLMVIDPALWLMMIVLLSVAVFLLVFYSAPPFQLAYRSLGEIAVWLGFGPVIVLISSVGQNLGIHPTLISVIPITGFSTLFISWMGELVDRRWDEAAGKRGLVLILGVRKSNYIFFLIHILVLINVIYVALIEFDPGYPILLALIPHVLIFPKYWYHIWNIEEEDNLKKAAWLNFWIYGLFSLALMAGFFLNLLL